MDDEDAEVDAGNEEVDEGDENVDANEPPEVEIDEVGEIVDANDESEQPAEYEVNQDEPAESEVEQNEQVEAEADEEQTEQQADVLAEDEGEDRIQSGISLLNIPADDESYNVTCAVCFCRYCTHVAKPCEHLCICTECVDEIKLKARENEGNNPLFAQLRCPMCNRPVTTFQII